MYCWESRITKFNILQLVSNFNYFYLLFLLCCKFYLVKFLFPLECRFLWRVLMGQWVLVLNYKFVLGTNNVERTSINTFFLLQFFQCSFPNYCNCVGIHVSCWLLCYSRGLLPVLYCWLSFEVWVCLLLLLFFVVFFFVFFLAVMLLFSSLCNFALCYD